jgi:hypothetical protein
VSAGRFADPPSEGRSPRRRRLQSARAALAWHAASFVVLQLALTLAGITWFPELRDPTFWCKFHVFHEAAGTEPAPITVVMFGSSCTANGFVGARFEARAAADLQEPVVAFNFGRNNAGPLVHQLGLERLLRAGIRPDMVIIEVFPVMLAAETKPSDIAPATLQPADLDLVRSHLGDRAFEQSWWESVLVPVYAQRVPLLSGAMPRLLRREQLQTWGGGMDPRGWFPLGLDMPRCDVHSKQAGWRRHHRRLRVGGPNVAIVADILHRAQQEGIAAVLVVMPQGPALRASFSAATQASIANQIADWRGEFGIPVIDARAWLDEEAFIDSIHLYAPAAQRFTARLYRELAPWFRDHAAQRRRAL